MQQKITEMLNAGIKPEEILRVLSAQVYDLIENNRITHRALYLMLSEYESFTDYFAAANEELSPSELDLLEELKDDLVYDVEMIFDNNEDLVKKQLCTESYGARIRQDLTERGVELPADLPEGTLPEDIIELSYPEVFDAYDRLKESFLEKLMSLSPKKAYDQGAAAQEEYRKKHHILFDEGDFIAEYSRTFSKDALMALLRERLTQAFTYGQHYELISDDDWEGTEEEAAEDGYVPETAEEEEPDEYLEADGPLEVKDYEYLFQLMKEYTGRRVMAAENQWGTGAYWTTYEDDFIELISYQILEHFEDVIAALSEDRPVEWDSFGRSLGLEKKDRCDAIQILDHSERINYFLERLNEELWTEFSETKTEEFLGK